MKRVFESLRSLVIWVIALPVFVLGCLVILLVALFTRGRRLEGLIKVCCRLVLFASGVRLRVRGRENVKAGLRYVVMMNHVNIFDPLVFYASFPGPLRGIEEESHFRWPFYGAVLRRIGQIPIDRKNSSKARESIQQAVDLVRSCKEFSIAILPEGTRTLDGKLGPFKRGGFHLALETGLDILPIVQKGGYRIIHKGSLLIRPGRVDLTIEPPVPIGGVSKENLQELVDKVRTVFIRSLGESTIPNPGRASASDTA
jgi:1-acyl-sn-glycerol-3-phosphate acyltransferase